MTNKRKQFMGKVPGPNPRIPRFYLPMSGYLSDKFIPPLTIRHPTCRVSPVCRTEPVVSVKLTVTFLRFVDSSTFSPPILKILSLTVHVSGFPVYLSRATWVSDIRQTLRLTCFTVTPVSVPGPTTYDVVGTSFLVYYDRR